MPDALDGLARRLDGGGRARGPASRATRGCSSAVARASVSSSASSAARACMRASSSVASARRRSRVERDSASVSRAASMARRRSAATSASVRRWASSSARACAAGRASASVADERADPPVGGVLGLGADAPRSSPGRRAARGEPRPVARERGALGGERLVLAPQTVALGEALLEPRRKRAMKSRGLALGLAPRGQLGLGATRRARSCSRPRSAPACVVLAPRPRVRPASPPRGGARRDPTPPPTRPDTRTTGPRTTSCRRVTKVMPGWRSASVERVARGSRRRPSRGRAARSAAERSA